VQVARLAGLPDAVIARAHDVLEMLERGDEGQRGAKGLIDDLPLFSVKPAPKPAPVRDSAVEARLKAVHPDALTPREALALVYDLHALLQDKTEG